MPSLVRACVRTRTTQSLGGIFPFHDRSPVERQIAAGEFVFPDEYFNTVSNDGTCRIRKAADEDADADDRSVWLWTCTNHPALDLCCRLLVVEPARRLSVDGALDHQWFLSTATLKLPSEM